MTGKVVIAGAGIAGLTAGAALARQGFDVEIYEQAPDLAEAGAGIQLSPNAMKVLDRLGSGAEVAERGDRPAFAAIRHWRTGAAHLRIALDGVCQDRYGAAFVQIHRSDLQSVLADTAQAAGVRLHLGRRIVGYDSGTTTSALLDNGEAISADLLIGADGIRSAVRDQMLGADAPRFTGHVAWRAAVPVQPSGLIAEGATVWAGPGRHVVTYPLRGGSMVNLVAVEERNSSHEESWTNEGDPSVLRATFKGWHPEVTKLMAQVDKIWIWSLHDRPALKTWTDGSVGLIGDASHPTLPFMAQGAAMGIEDAGLLSVMLGTGVAPATALRSFEARRKQRTMQLQARARANGALFHLTEGPFGMISKAKLMAAGLLQGSMAMWPLDWIYRYDAMDLVEDG
ncbi:MAG: FAD-dependent monooxygenase [Pseudomonadota bacterium]